MLHSRWCCNKAATLVQVILKTSLGDIDIELWPKEAPKVRIYQALTLHVSYIYWRKVLSAVKQAKYPAGFAFCMHAKQ